MGLFGDLFDIATSPIRIIDEVASTVTKPIATLANELVEEVKEVTDDIKNGM